MIRQKRMYECTLCGTLDQLDVLCDGTPEDKHKACKMTPIVVFYGTEVEALVRTSAPAAWTDRINMEQAEAEA